MNGAALTRAIELLEKSAAPYDEACMVLRQLQGGATPMEVVKSATVADALQTAFDFMRMPAYQFAQLHIKGHAYNADDAQALVQTKLAAAMKEMGMEVKP